MEREGNLQMRNYNVSARWQDDIWEGGSDLCMKGDGGKDTKALV